MTELIQTERAKRLLSEALECCVSYRHEFITPEHLLLVLLTDDVFYRALNDFTDHTELSEQIEQQLEELETIPEDMEYQPEVSAQMSDVVGRALEMIVSSSAEAMDMPHLVRSILVIGRFVGKLLAAKCIGR